MSFTIRNLNKACIENLLLKCWSVKTSSNWTRDNPYKGQCNVTALVINDLFGGRILKTLVDSQWHYYNWINGERYDFTAKQFDFMPDYQDLESCRTEVFHDSSYGEYQHLKELLLSEIFQY